MSCWPTRRVRSRSSAPTRRPVAPSWRRTAATAPTSPRSSPRTRPKGAKARTSSLFKSMSLETMTLDEALQLLTLPRVVGVDPESGEEITAQNGRYGPYLKKGTDSRSIDSEEQLLTITLDEALKIYAEPKQRGARRRRHRCASSAPTRPSTSRSWSRTAGSGRTSPTASSTRPCARTTRSSRSPWSGRPSCSATSAPRARPPRSARPRRPRRRLPPRSASRQEDRHQEGRPARLVADRAAQVARELGRAARTGAARRARDVRQFERRRATAQLGRR